MELSNLSRVGAQFEVVAKTFENADSLVDDAVKLLRDKAALSNRTFRKHPEQQAELAAQAGAKLAEAARVGDAAISAARAAITELRTNVPEFGAASTLADSAQASLTSTLQAAVRAFPDETPGSAVAQIQSSIRIRMVDGVPSSTYNSRSSSSPASSFRDIAARLEAEHIVQHGT